MAADGPRRTESGEAELCEATREIVKRVDWECEVQTHFQDNNLGLKLAVSSSINWFFDHAQAGIILEDDCLPSQSFFWFCQELLDRYREDERIMQISGSNFLLGEKVTEASYYFSKLNDVWGWATWRRAWNLLDFKMETFPQFVAQGQLENYFDDRAMQTWFMAYLEDAYSAATGAGLWSTLWTYAMCMHNGLTIAPSVNLVENLGLSGTATHQVDAFALYAEVGRNEMVEMLHPLFVLQNKSADAFRFEIIRRTDPRASRIFRARQLARKHLPTRYHNVLKALERRVRR